MPPDDLIFPDVAAQILDVPNIRAVHRMVARGDLKPYAYVSNLRRRVMVFERSYIEDKRRQLDELRAAQRALREK